MTAMDAEMGAGLQLGENGTPEYGDLELPPALALFNAGVRGVDRARLADLVRRLVHTSPACAADCGVIVMQLRDIRGGKGERAAALAMLCELSRHCPKAAVALVPLLPEYGCWRDMLALMDAEHTQVTPQPLARRGHRAHRKPWRAPAPNKPLGVLGSRALEAFVTQLRADNAAAPESPISLAAKWAPRAHHRWSQRAKALAAALFPHSKTAAADYRRLVARLASRAACPEQAMCSGKYAEIQFDKVPSKAMAKYRKAFLNERANGPPPTAAEDETGNRKPESADRVACRKRLRDAVKSGDIKKIKGAAMMPHELVRRLMSGHHARSSLEADLVDIQWSSLIEETKVKLAGAEAPPDGRAVDLGKMIALVDVSASMTGTPMEAAIALGLMVQELAAPAFRGRVLTFESVPQWVAVPARGVNGASLKDAVHAVQCAPWGGSTDIAAALERVLSACESARCKMEDVPELLVLSDMQFDQANRGSRAGAWETAHSRLVRRFAETGARVCGKPWPAPTVTYWNLRGDTYGHVARADVAGVRMLSGYSPALLKLVLAGDFEMEQKSAGPTPWETLRKCLDDQRYDPVRAVLSAAAQADDADTPLKGYAWAKPSETMKLGVDCA